MRTSAAVCAVLALVANVARAQQSGASNSPVAAAESSAVADTTAAVETPVASPTSAAVVTIPAQTTPVNNGGGQVASSTPAAQSPVQQGTTSAQAGTTAAQVVTTAAVIAGTTQQQAAAATTPVSNAIIPAGSSVPANAVVVVVTTLGRTATVTGTDPSAASSQAAASLAASNDSSSSSGGGVAGWIIAVAVVGGLAGAGLLGYLIWFFGRRRFSGLDDEDRDQPIRWPELKQSPGDNDSFAPAAAARPVTGMDLGSEFHDEMHSSHGSLGYVQSGQYVDDPRQSYYDPYMGQLPPGAGLQSSESHSSMGYSTPHSPSQQMMSEHGMGGRPLSSYSAFSAGSGHQSQPHQQQMPRPGSGLSMYSQGGGAQVWPPTNRASMASTVSPPPGVDLNRGASIGSNATFASSLDRGPSARSVADMRAGGQRGPLHVANLDEDENEKLA